MNRAETGGDAIRRMIDFASRRPASALAALLALHVLVRTLLPILLYPNLPLDVIEDLALGKEWELGYWKHPSLPWVLADTLYRITHSVNCVYLLGPLSAALCFYGVYLLAREVTDERHALIAVLALEGIHFYSFSVIKFSHNQLMLPFWAFTGLFFYRALARGRLRDWALAGVFLAGSFWSKYASVVLAATLGLFLLIEPTARRSWRTPGPYVMALAFALVIAPNAWWLVAHEFLPFQYVDERAQSATHWPEYILFPLRWIGAQALLLVPAGALLALLYRRGDRLRPATDAMAAFNRRYVTAIALGPFLLTTAIAMALGRRAITMWAYPFWSFAPLAALMWWPPACDATRLRRFAFGFLAMFVAVPLAYAAIDIGEPLLRDRAKATEFPGQVMADAITRAWHESYGTPLVYVGGTEFETNNLAVYSADRPHAIPHGNPALAPWVDAADLRRRGAVLVWRDDFVLLVPRWEKEFGKLEIQPTLVLARQTLFPVKPSRIHYGFAPPQR